MKRYEGLFILNTAGREEGIKEAIDKITAEITQIGGKVETVQKMDRRPFARVTDRKVNAGFYVNFIFEALPTAVSQLRTRLALTEEVYRAIYTDSPEPVPAPVPAAA